MMNPQAASDFVLLHVVAPDLEASGGSGIRTGIRTGIGVKPLPSDGSRRPVTLLQDAACKLQHFDFPGTKGSRPQLMVFRNLVQAEDGAAPGTGSGPGDGTGDNVEPGRLRLSFPRVKPGPSPPRSPGCCPRQEERVFDLARDFGGFSVAGGGGEWPGPPGCECSALGASGHSPRSAAEEPTETSDAVLVLEGIEPGVGGLDIGACEPEPPPAAARTPQLLPEQDSRPPGTGSNTHCPRLQQETKVRLARCCSSPSTSLRDGEDKLLYRLPAKSRKSSLKIRLSKLFRTKSYNGGSGDPAAKRHSMELETPAGCLHLSKLQQGYDMRSKPRLTRTQSAFAPVSLASPFTGETVSLVDLDISCRGPPSPHPPTAPPPPRRSLSLLDTLQRNSPQSRPMTVQPQHCLLNRRDSSSFAASLRELEKCGWYWGPMNWDDAEMKLKGKPDGSFLVRDSSDPRYILSLSFRSQGITHHTRMEHYRGTFSLWCHPKFEDRCQSVVEFIERAIMHSKNGKFLYFLRSRVPGLPPTPVQLLYPVSRFSNVKSLQHLCRFRIRQLVRIDHIPELPLPKPLISYLRKFYYYDPEEEAYLSLREVRLHIAHEQDMDTQT
ncbi:suppressor of cytokine signaling 7 isoform X2 [Heterodontus francisci]|uniref:suppressor of cytokine signaling 7 isoform X2 n=1 Tax=Heterodontus francisci TaxID=7792 RepID=UPI00355B4B8E